ncbi:MAG: hypothetical protein A3G32_01565 [Deltaproteobacteria bacterium RIFCSPLOWO2_12_FULL_40_28]|nr:MAG: hypothetical protein A3C45_06310 [Deltaproteobacteria bacterium RIFCSPHIGHO2_02_FULL_40_28]OGQ18820.1 MAG: hypothetical protein A3E27_08945 [Deltaproteobacteria bacterium RIFCSPHIGHO2_12_FULL_40_32]OGQ40065.1 MAG: hypothetical protein A3I69_01475 [Deltaproteobacteria bacterium RIFCSPLOWO2_02_FULL_40_36]OGQ53248.1 MAG: hypothetical protein A3G32_01565 [Deltaproteobacteria bacterium RIFCSPLOWO2_12_FULL_40_28]
MPKKNRYRLEPLLQLKERRKRQTEIALSKAIKKLDDEKEKLKKLTDLKKEVIRQREHARNDMNQKVATGQARIKESQFHLGFMIKLQDDQKKVEDEIKDQTENVVHAEEKLKRARRDYLDAAQELNVMEKHKELWTKKEKKTLDAKENKLMNELGNTVYQLNRMRS